MENIFLERLTEILDTQLNLDMDIKLGNVEEWDSLGMVSFIAMADVEYGKKVIFSDLKNAQTVRDLYMLVKS